MTGPIRNLPDDLRKELGQSSLSACEVVTTGLHRISDMLGLEAKSFRSSRSVSASEADGLIDMRTAGKHVQLAP